jgi:hypothetical protein
VHHRALLAFSDTFVFRFLDQQIDTESPPMVHRQAKVQQQQNLVIGMHISMVNTLFDRWKFIQINDQY